MSGLSNWFGFLGASSDSDVELPEIFPISITQSEFVKIDVVNVYSKILTDVVERTHGLSEDQTQLLWDNCVKSEASDGLVSLLSKAMAEKKDLFLVYEQALKVLRVATNEEETQIKADYKKKGESSVGIFISFKNYTRTDMVKLYSALEHCTVAALHKSMNLSKAVQFKMFDLRGSTALTDSQKVIDQAKVVAKGLAKGNDVLIDSKDIIETVMPKLDAVVASIDFLNQKRAYYLGLPECYINGEQTGGLGSSGEQDTKAIERGLKSYYSSIMKPVLEALFGKKVSYKSQDFRQIAGSMEVLKTFSLVDEELISAENKLKVINALFDFPENTKGDAPKEPDHVILNEGQKFVAPPSAKAPNA